MAEFRFDVDMKVRDARAAARNPYAEGLRSIRALMIEAVDEVQAEVRVHQVLTALNEGRYR